MPLQFVKPERLSLRSHPDFDEAWVQQRIVEDPSILELGDVDVVERERAQGKAGRLDLLLSDPDQNIRYELELMLGPTDPSHIVRTIEYWDIERRRFPAYDHVAVLVAEDVTARFLNVLALLSGSIPIIAIQLNALKVGDQIVLDFVHVLDQRDLRTDDIEEAGDRAAADRPYWEKKTSSAAVRLMDAMLEMINAKAATKQSLSYKRQFVGLTDGNRSRNFVVFRPRKKHVWVGVPKLSDAAKWVERLEEAGVEAAVRGNGVLRVAVHEGTLRDHGTIIRELFQTAVAEYEDDA